MQKLSMVSKDLARLRHMLDSTNAILSFVKGKKRASLDANRLLASGIIREFEVLGEAAGKVSPKTKALYPQLPWKQQLNGMRNRLIHAYFDVDHDVIWKTIKDNLPSFQRQLEKIIDDLRKDG
ncbi:MAG: DUF86 domain-containing protein [Chlamydiales bacterium]